MALEDWGWDADWQAAADRASTAGAPARVVGQERDRWALQQAATAAVGRVVAADRLVQHPVVGDWVLTQPGPTVSDPWSILAVLPRRTAFSRGAAGSGARPQVLAANVDVVWIVHGLDLPLNPRRLERYLATGWESGAVPHLVLTKGDLAEHLPETLVQARALAPGVDVHVVRRDDPHALTGLASSLRPGVTVALLGPSGVGKSTLVNLLDPAVGAATGTVREKDRKGRHTTTRRELFRIGSGALLLDTPGIRELRLWALDEGLGQAFPEIEELAGACRFGDCRHESEPGCAVLAAEAEGRLDPERLASFRKLRAEAAFQARKLDPEARRAAVAEHKTALKTLKHHHKYRRE